MIRTTIRAAACAFALVACAQGGRGDGGDDVGLPIDAAKVDATSSFIDAPITPPLDAGVDAVPPTMIDAMNR